MVETFFNEPTYTATHVIHDPATKRAAGLALPHLILPSVQVNMRGGRLPLPEENGRRYLKPPIDPF